MRDILCKRPRFEIKREILYGKHVKFTKNTLYCSDVYNLAQKLDNSIEIVKITGHA